MDTWHIILLALLQGITEFLPISSSAHLILFPQLMGWEDQGIAFDVSLHIGSLIAVLVYFRVQLREVFGAWFTSLRTGKIDDESRLVWGIAVATIPAALVGLLVSVLHLDEKLRQSVIIASTTIIFGALLWYADSMGKRQRSEYSLGWKEIILIGLAQALAIIPGTSRSGVTMTAALLLGLERKAAARFSFLLSIPVIVLAGSHEMFKLIRGVGLSPEESHIHWNDIGIGMVVSAISAYVCIHTLIKLLDKIGMLPFVIYRFILGIILWVWIV
ncbi:MAG: undecaprenyl-diphosphate phosphatase [Thiotrichaceae bacterium]|nr:undecaprenyl-diphosphate phosphatase [Thiotrichaceae bacterium]